jgi:hypothetical protein
VEDVTEGVLQAAVRKTVDGIKHMVELQRDHRKPSTRAGNACLWCPLITSCKEGASFIVRRNDPDATNN